MEAFAIEAIERAGRLQLPPVIEAVDEFLAAPSERMDRSGKSRCRGDDNLGSAGFGVYGRITRNWPQCLRIVR